MKLAIKKLVDLKVLKEKLMGILDSKQKKVVLYKSMVPGMKGIVHIGGHPPLKEKIK